MQRLAGSHRALRAQCEALDIDAGPAGKAEVAVAEEAGEVARLRQACQQLQVQLETLRAGPATVGNARADTAANGVTSTYLEQERALLLAAKTAAEEVRVEGVQQTMLIEIPPVDPTEMRQVQAVYC